MANYPSELLYTKDHEWCRIDGDVARVGITWHAQSALGDVVFCELPQVGDTVGLGQTFGVVESVKAVSDLYAPVSGTVVKRNDALTTQPEAINADCYDAWMIEIQMSSPEEKAGLLSAKDYVAGLEAGT